MTSLRRQEVMSSGEMASRYQVPGLIMLCAGLGPGANRQVGQGPALELSDDVVVSAEALD